MAQSGVLAYIIFSRVFLRNLILAGNNNLILCQNTLINIPRFKNTCFSRVGLKHENQALIAELATQLRRTMIYDPVDVD